MTLITIMLDYFQGEKIEALVFILPIGLLSLVFGTSLVTEGGSFAKGIAVPFILMGLVMSVVGGVVGFRTPAQVQTLEIGLTTQPEATKTAEIQRMEKVNDAWPKYLVIWAAFGVIGLALRFLVKHDFAHGLGIALVFFSGVALLIDGFAERRARIYMSALMAEKIEQTH
ncbi:MAG: hypothetical protein RI932_1473 [Pseudomonadota bacterium]|jgi:hypothetical protein